MGYVPRGEEKCVELEKKFSVVFASECFKIGVLGINPGRFNLNGKMQRGLPLVLWAVFPSA
jgi:hypothetical protein